ncbi:hypothetical protein [Aliiruegeria lutimaris]|uniref:Uncharacterized protein n=1 Tax=Aliiruegeria lutimaris TaxID=571298 RepID=A0A1G9QC51_9RHOB|nr:hypothetical protein [Aliiruegeria lutimaris]SDM08490.1 hypothetical protein SAMN04488026_11671 [Aliiruegeria lutimaris]
MKLFSILPVALVLFAAGHAAIAQQIDFELDETLTMLDTEVAFRLELGLSAVAPTRVHVNALLDLRDIQQRMPELLAGRPVSDGCGNNTVLGEVSVTARDSVIGVSGTLQSRFYQCNRTSETGFQRGELRSKLGLGFTGEATTKIEENCIVFRLEGLDVRPLEAIEAGTEDSENITAARLLLREAFNLVLAESPFCLELPPELSMLDPVFQTAGPREIGKGGIGVALEGSVDVSTHTILAILGVLQSEGVLPGPP